jgi:hypothetical protein
MREDVREIKTRLGRLGTELAGLHGFIAEQSVRLERVKRRLELTEPV